MKSCVFLALVMLLLAASFSATAQPAFAPPEGGWTYIYQGDLWDPEPLAALDGLWNHEDGSDAWDGTEITDGNPGGVSALTETIDDVTTTFLRIQDPGDPRGYSMPDPSNRKIYLGYNITDNDAPANAETLLDDGVTITFRSRVVVPGDGVELDLLYPSDNSGELDWPETGDGYVVHDGGKGNFSIHQGAGGTISFCLALPTDHAYLELYEQEGLLMNRLGANVNWQGATLEEIETDVAVNVLPLDPRQWHEFWITIEKAEDTGDGGTHVVNVYTDGATESTEFLVTAGSGSDFTGAYLAIGCGATPQSGCYDIDFVGYREGVYKPQGGSAVKQIKSPEAFALLQNYPNPFNPSTTIEYALSKDGFVSLEVFDHLGRKVRSLVDGFQQACHYTVNFDAENLANGIYFCQLSLDGQPSATRKMILMK